MSRHVPRHERWSKLGPNEYRLGSMLVRFVLLLGRRHGDNVRFERTSDTS